MKKILLIIILILITKNINSQWIVTSQPSGFDIFDCSFINSETGYICGYGNTIYKTLTGGVNWINLSFPGTAQNINAIYFFDVNTGMIVSTNDTLYRTTNGGTNWDTKVFIGYPATKFFFLDNNTGWATGYGRLAKTTNGGFNWVVSNSITYGPVHFINSMTGWTSDYSSGSSTIYKTTDGSVNWIPQYTATNFRIIYSMFFLNENTGWVSGYREFIAKTTNGGINWVEQNFTSGGQGIYSIEFTNQNTGWASADGSKIFSTSNGGNNWSSTILSPNSGRFTKVHFVNQSTGWLTGQYGRVFRTTNTGGLTNTTNTTNETPDKFKLSQNYPNPFNPSTIIKFSVPQLSSLHALGRDLVTLKVYNILGKEVATLVNENLQPGTYEIPFSINQYTNIQYPSGVYFYKIIAGDFTDTKRMLMIK